MEWMNRLLRGDRPAPPTSSPSPVAWDEMVELARSPDGHRRQAAVRALSTSGHGPALPVLLERLNDWVDAVRRDARVAIDNFLCDDLLDAWIAALPGVAALTRGARADHSDTLRRIVEWLMEPPRLARLRAAPVVVPTALERLMFRARLRASVDEPSREAAWRDALRSADIVLACEAADILRKATTSEARHDDATRRLLVSLSRDALGSRFAAVRLTGLRAARGLSPVDAQQMARTLCFDRNANARALAIGILREDAASIATLRAQALAGLDATHPARDRATALQALCTLDDASGLAACRELLQDPLAEVRAVALRRVLVGADLEERDRLVRDALADPSSKVRRIAVAQVHRGANPPSPEALASLGLARPASLGSVLAVATHLSPWQRITLLLEIVRQLAPFTPAADQASLAVDHWCVDMYRCFLTLTPTQADVVRSAWTGGRDQLPRSLQQAVSRHLRSFGVLAG